MRPPLRDTTTLITGASSGIGQELARQLASLAGRLILVARRRDRLEALRTELLARHPSLLVEIHPCDLADDKAREQLLASVGAVDVLINNAGVGDFAFVEHAAWERLERMIVLNVTALTHLTWRLLGPMRERGRGGILNVSSGLGLTFLPGFAVYSATKHYVSALTEALRAELAGTGIVVSQLCPGPVDTEFEQVANGAQLALAVPRVLQLSAAQCARGALRGFARGRALIIPGLRARLLNNLPRITPLPLLRWVFAGLARLLRRRL